MTFQLDQATLQSITQEVRQCFLFQDAPEYMNILERGLENRDGDFKSLLRAAHSLKGGAGVAELPSLNDLAHKLEDLLQIMEKREVQDEELAWLILERGVTEVAFLLDQAGTGQEVQVDPELLQTLAAFQQSQTTVGARTETVNGPNNSFIVTALQQDLEDSFATVEELPADTPEEIVRECLENFCDECLFLGETLDLVWLIEGVAPLEAVREEADTSAALTLALDAIANLRTVRDRYLTVQLEPAENKEAEDAVLDSVEDTTPHSSIPDTSLSHLRVPLKQLEDITNTVEELILTQERLREQQRQLTQANLRLRQLAHQFEPIREQIQSFYDQLAITPEGMASVNPALTGPALLGLKPQAMEFDRLELDRFTTLHSSLQTFQELMLRVREVRADINLSNYQLNENLEYESKKLNKLYGSITQSRLVTFGLLAQRFLPQIQNLNRRYPHKLVVLEIKGEEVLVDQLLLEQLQTPLTHLLNNAFDHGITPRAARVDNGKPETATIVLKAARSQNQLVITITDDGEGINLERVYRAALERGLCPTSSDMDQFSTEEILQWIFQPDFSTAPKVSELSGRGMGLDIVRSQVQRLRGTIQVETEVGQGTIFTLKFPRSLSKVSLLLVQLQGRIVAIPTASIRETLLFKELEWLQLEPPVANWYSQAVSVIPLSEIFSVIVMANHNREGIGSNLALGPKVRNRFRLFFWSFGGNCGCFDILRRIHCETF